jgi:5-(carboxyamino)imidazole ribonucleotide synthase
LTAHGKTGPLGPGSVVGVLGSGQLGRMLALEARDLGYPLHVYSPGRDTPAGRVGAREVSAPYDDLDAVREFARRCAVVTFEFENVPAATAAAAAEETRVRPAGRVLHVAQNRLREKVTLSGHGFPTARYRPAASAAEAEAGARELGGEVIVKTAGFGYDGKGQARAATPEEAAEAFGRLVQGPVDDGRPRVVLEEVVAFDRELSVVAARGADGSFAAFDVFANDHENHILDLTVCPAPVSPEVARRAHELARGIFESLDVVGVLCVELFHRETGSTGGELVVNELAPRPHNSGHLTLDACATSQFEQQLRAACGLPLGSPELLRPAAMANLLGDLWISGPDGDRREPDWAAALAVPGVRLHLYEKKEPRPGRKMGHLTAVGSTVDEARQRVLTARKALTARAPRAGAP